MNTERVDMRKRSKMYLVNGDGAIDVLNGGDNCNRLFPLFELSCRQSVGELEFLIFA